MKKSIIIAAAFAAATSASSTAIAAPKPVELSASELAAVQSKSYTVPANVAFNSTVAALQTLGYVDIVSSRDSGTISATTESKAKVIYNVIWGLGKKKYTQKASLLVEDNGPAGALVRLNLHVNETKSRGIFGTSFSDGKLVSVAEPYREFYTALDAEIARRAPMAAPAAAAPVVAPTAAVN